MLYINNSSSPYSEQRVSLGGEAYTLVFKFNIRNNCWYVSILNATGTSSLIEGLQVKPNQSLTGRYTDIGFQGELWCVRVKSETSPISVDNLGREGVYRLAWLSREEASELSNLIQEANLNA